MFTYFDGISHRNIYLVNLIVLQDCITLLSILATLITKKKVGSSKQKGKKKEAALSAFLKIKCAQP